MANVQKSSGETFGMRVFEKQFFTLLLSLFSLTWAERGQNSIKKYSPVVTSRWVIWWRILWSALWGTFLKEKNLSTFSKVFKMLKPKRITIERFFFNSVAYFIKIGNPSKFLKIIVCNRLCRGKGFLPLEGWRFRWEISRVENKILKFSKGLTSRRDSRESIKIYDP